MTQLYVFNVTTKEIASEQLLIGYPNKVAAARGSHPNIIYSSLFLIIGYYSEKIYLTYSTFFVQSGGLLMVINTQLVKIVHMISMLNNVGTVKENTVAIHTISHQSWLRYSKILPLTQNF